MYDTKNEWPILKRSAVCEIIEKLKFSKFPSRIPQYVGKMDEVIGP